MNKAAFYIPSLDGIRAAAVLLVFAAHAGLNDRVPGNFGVTVFFFLSGYLITTLLRAEFDRTNGINVRDFYVRRVLRIFPPFYLALLGASLLCLAGWLDGFLTPDAVFAQLFYFSNYYIIAHGWWDGRAPGTWVYWSLAVEEHFYLFFPLVYLVLRRHVPARSRQALLLFAACLLVFVWRCVLVFGLAAAKDRTYIASDTRVDSILWGCALAVVANPVLDKARVPERWLKFVLTPLGFALLVLSFAVRGQWFEETIRYSLQGLALLPLFTVAIRYPDWFVFRLLNLRSARFVGVLSYSVYLLHPTVMYAVAQHTRLHPALQGLASLGVTLALAVIIYQLVEKPSARLRKRLSASAGLTLQKSAEVVVPPHQVAGRAALPAANSAIHPA